MRGVFVEKLKGYPFDPGAPTHMELEGLSVLRGNGVLLVKAGKRGLGHAGSAVVDQRKDPTHSKPRATCA